MSLLADIYGSTLCSCQFVSETYLVVADFLSEFRFLSYLLSQWMPALVFSHTILFLVGLWALVDKESVEAVVSVSLQPLILCIPSGISIPPLST